MVKKRKKKLIVKLQEKLKKMDKKLGKFAVWITRKAFDISF